MLPVVHGRKRPFAGSVAFIYLVISDPRTRSAPATLKFRTTPQFLILDAHGRVPAERSGVIPATDFERWIAETVGN